MGGWEFLFLMSSYQTRSYLWVDDLSAESTLQLFSQAKQIKRNIRSGIHPKFLEGSQVALVFSEASTRTKMSFQMAAQRLGAQCLVIDNVKSSSMSKGETFEDTFWTLHAIRPNLFVIRCGDDDPLPEVTAKSQVPVINAGFGARAHPTQALLDVFTIQEKKGHLKGLKVVFVGDIDHSRVAFSDMALLKTFGADVKICAPPSFRQKRTQGVEAIEKLDEALAWCDVYVGLRVQNERHQDSTKHNQQDFVSGYSLDEKRLGKLNSEAIIMHPGPVNWGVEFQRCVLEDSRLVMWEQKENGVYTRAALMQELLRG
jgi:aspartate carbamoyltransferase catalytic subunit